MLGSQDQTINKVNKIEKFSVFQIIYSDSDKNSKCNERVQEEQKVVIEPIKSIKECFSEEVTAGRMAGC